MKNIYLLLGIFYCSSLFAQHSSPITTLSTQAEVDNFGLAHVQGDLFIGVNSSWQDTDITNLQGLSTLISVSGKLTIKNIDMLTSLQGLDQLSTVEGDFEIRNNERLTGLNGLSSLATIGGRFWIIRNLSMTDPTGMTSLNSIGWLWLSSTPLTDLTFLQNITSIAGSLYFDSTNMEDFIGLENLTSIGGDLRVGDYYYDYYDEAYFFDPNSALVNLDGLNNLTSVGGVLFIIKADNLIDISTLSNVTHVGGTMEIAFNNSLSNLSGLDNFILDGRLSIHNNPSLSACSTPAICDHLNNGGLGGAFNNNSGCNSNSDVLAGCSLPCSIQSVVLTTQGQIDSFAINYPGCTDISGSVTIGGGDAITNLNGLSQITSIGGNLDIGADLVNVNTTALTDLTGLENLTSIGGNLNIGNYFYDYGPNNEIITVFIPSSLTSLDGLNSLTSIGTSFNLVAAEGLTDITALNNLTSIGGDMLIFNNDALTNLSGLDNLTDFNGNLTIWDNELLSDISSLAGLTMIGNSGIGNPSTGGLYIENNLSLSSFFGLHNITNIAGSLIIENNDALTTFAGLESLMTIGGWLKIWYNDALTSLTGLNNLTTVGAVFYIHENALLSSLSGLNSLTSIGTYAVIFRNPSLMNLNSLENLAVINEFFQIRDNLALTDINTLQNLDSIGGELQMHGNTDLSFCGTLSVCNHLMNNRPANIYNNLTGCNTEQEILDACNLLPIEMTASLQVHLNDKTAVLRWRTATEINNAGFEVQRSKDGMAWERIGWKAGQGNTTTPQSYTYIDENPFFGISYYRLKQVDFNGDIAYSNVVSLRYMSNGVTVYPNPVKDLLYVRTDYGVVQQITIYDSTGKQIIDTTNRDESIDISAFPKGIYMMKITIEEEDFYKKIIIE